MNIVLLTSLLALGLLAVVWLLARSKPSHPRASESSDSSAYLPVLLATSMGSESTQCVDSASDSSGCDGGGGDGGGGGSGD